MRNVLKEGAHGGECKMEDSFFKGETCNPGECPGNKKIDSNKCCPLKNILSLINSHLNNFNFQLIVDGVSGG